MLEAASGRFIEAACLFEMVVAKQPDHEIA